MVDNNVTGPVSSRRLFGAVRDHGGRQGHVCNRPAPTSTRRRNEDLTQVTAAVIGRLSLALQEAAEARTPRAPAAEPVCGRCSRRCCWSAALFVVVRLHRLIAAAGLQGGRGRVSRQTGLPTDDVEVRGSWVLVVVRRVARFVAIAVGAVLVYTWLTYVLQQFPVTRPWGEALGGFLVATVERSRLERADGDARAVHRGHHLPVHALCRPPDGPRLRRGGTGPPAPGRHQRAACAADAAHRHDAAVAVRDRHRLSVPARAATPRRSRASACSSGWSSRSDRAASSIS